MGLPFGVHRASQSLVEPFHGRRNGMDAPLGCVASAPWIGELMLANGLQFLAQLGLYRLADQVVFELGLDLFLAAAQRAEGLGFVEAKVALLDKVGGVSAAAVKGADFQGEAQTVDWFSRRMEQEPADVGETEFVLEDRLAAFENETPETEVAAEGILGCRLKVASRRLRAAAGTSMRSSRVWG
jgi:hypothetical protein